ncbi:ABC transporter permease [Natronoglycomyces albus]|uniref:ABC transporter permease n=1 Tax=Natronoglycomyces albus TaxID=2811108 RepID=A0A895XR33_9ACTN|nr:ABC transporter permease [Natronoglycomyces albus]QSB04730.1 ABC transporter permease [Natronoglycomyces albus]
MRLPFGKRRSKNSEERPVGTREDSRFGVTTLGIIYEAFASVRGRSVRAWLTAAGIALGIAATVATVGLSTTAQSAISGRFDEALATQVTVAYPSSFSGNPSLDGSQRVRGIEGVSSGGLTCFANEDVAISRTAEQYYSRSAPVAGVEPGAIEAYDFTVLEGRAFDEGHMERSDNVAMLESTIARDLGFTGLDGSPKVFLDGEGYTVIGIFRAPVGEAKFTGSVAIPPEPCLTGASGFGSSEMFIRTNLGAADKVGEQAPLALYPEAPESLQVAVPSDLRNFRQGVENEMEALLLGLAAVSLVIGAVSVSNTALVSVMERRTEIGLRRAVGAPRRAVAMQFVWESVFIGLVGGIVGAVLGVNVTVFVSIFRDWQLVFDPLLLAAGPVIGALVGVIAGVYPAWRASRVAPAVTLRS